MINCCPKDPSLLPGRGGSLARQSGAPPASLSLEQPFACRAVRELLKEMLLFAGKIVWITSWAATKSDK